MVHTVWKKRAIAAVMSVAMLGTSMAATPIVWAAGNEISVNKTLEVARILVRRSAWVTWVWNCNFQCLVYRNFVSSSPNDRGCSH